MEAWQERMVEEYVELVKRLRKLDDYLTDFRGERTEEYGLLATQFYAMQAYRMALETRLMKFVDREYMLSLLDDLDDLDD